MQDTRPSAQLTESAPHCSCAFLAAGWLATGEQGQPSSLVFILLRTWIWIVHARISIQRTASRSASPTHDCHQTCVWVSSRQHGRGKARDGLVDLLHRTATRSRDCLSPSVTGGPEKPVVVFSRLVASSNPGGLSSLSQTSASATLPAWARGTMTFAFSPVFRSYPRRQDGIGQKTPLILHFCPEFYRVQCAPSEGRPIRGRPRIRPMRPCRALVSRTPLTA